MKAGRGQKASEFSAVGVDEEKYEALWEGTHI